MKAHVALSRIVDAVSEALNTRIGFNPYSIFDKFDSDNDGFVNSDELQAIFGALHLKHFTAIDFNEASQLLEKNNEGYFLLKFLLTLLS